ncbi:hypothetical protein LCGC14_0208390 [marine sediment metagenome]|uniref:Uncharacterized protein n=1 Tax=marine sediment metagenome TaxID=412755 RepID=A0A0F9XJW7_9ZZZZ
MRSKLKRDMSTKKSRDFWAGVERACNEFHKLPQWQQDLLKHRWEEIHKEYENRVPTCYHCGQETGGSRCYPCYG